MLFVGDIHAKFRDFTGIVRQHINTQIVQVGDMGIGFNNIEEDILNECDFKFIRGNHDNPFKCAEDKHYLGDYGYKSGMFFISGAYSIDRHKRLMDHNWWKEEELDYEQCNEVVDMYGEIKPDLVVSHDCPSCMFERIKNHHNTQKTKTRQLLNRLIEIYVPDFWIFGHHHYSVKQILHIGKDNKRCRFIGLNELEVFEMRGQE